MKLRDILRESLNDAANERIDSLPQGKVFDDAKRIDGVFKKSSHSWSEVIEALEQNKKNGERQEVNTTDIRITQPNVQSGKVKRMVQGKDGKSTIDVVQFPDGEMAIHDGHHRLTANWALGNKTIVVNLIKAQQK
jgi:hypothetical protein